jgi:hypothetical protein
MKPFSKLVMAVMLCAGFCAFETQAASVVYGDNGFILETGYHTHKFTIENAGTYKVTLTNFEFPDYLDQLSVSINTYDTEINTLALTDSERQGYLFFEAEADSIYFANVFGVGAGDLQLGLYGIKISLDSLTPTAVPLPSSLLFLVSSMVVMGAAGRGGKLTERFQVKSLKPTIA